MFVACILGNLKDDIMIKKQTRLRKSILLIGIELALFETMIMLNLLQLLPWLIIIMTVLISFVLFYGKDHES